MDNKFRELFELAMSAINETGAYVHFDICNHGHRCSVYIMDKGFKKENGYDGWYDMTDSTSGYSLKNYRRAKRHLKRLITKATEMKQEA